ncbi:MAG: DUF3078 domain-containing protein [Chitinophagaceae bacterium]
MMKKMLFVICLISTGAASAQDAVVKGLKSTAEKELAEDTTHKEGWKKGFTANLGLAQGNTSNWAAGAERSSFTINAFVNLFANYKKGKKEWTNSLDLFYAMINTSSLGTRKNDDRIDYYTKYTQKIKPKVGLGVVGNFRTQFTNGYTYNVVPQEKVSGFFKPAYLTIAPGIDWDPNKWFSLFFSPISARWIYVSEDSLTKYYNINAGKNLRTELGGFLSAKLNKDIAKNVNIRSRVDLFSNYLENPQNVDVFWTNILTLKVNKFLNVTYNFDMIYDDDVKIFGTNSNAPRTQIKSLLSVNFTTKF